MERQSRRTFLQLCGGVLGGIATGTTVTAATRTDRFIVDTRGVGPGAIERAGLEVVHDMSVVDLAVVRGAESAVRGAVRDYAPDVEISFDEPVVRAEAGSEATDEPLYPFQWDKAAQDIPAVHERTRGEGTRVAVIDTGVGAGHPDLEHAVNADLSRDFTGDGYGAPGPWGGYHGSHVAGIIAANDENDVGVVGSAPGTEIVDCRVFSLGELASFGDILAALVYSAAIGADAANMSIGAYPIPRNAYRTEDGELVTGLGEFYGGVLNRTTTYANRQGTLLVVSAGNAAADLQHDANLISLPNEAAQAMSISATGPIGFMWGDDGLEDSPESPAFYTNYGTNAVDLAAPGGDADLEAIGTGVDWIYDLVVNTIAVPDPNDLGNPESVTYTYDWLVGTSMAAPQVTAAAALVKSANPGYGPGQVERALENAASVPDGEDKAYYGAGFLEPLRAL